MKIGACYEDLAITCGSIVIVLLCEFFLLLIWSWNIFAIVFIVNINMFLAISFAKDIIYFGRRVSLDYNGCTFSIIGRQKKVDWDDMTVYIFEKAPAAFCDAEVRSTGILLIPKSKKYETSIAPMTFCRRKCANSGVYIRFSDSEHLIKSGKLVYEGYCTQKNKLLRFLGSNGIVINSVPN